MKKLIASLLILCLIPCVCFADFDLAGMNFSELSDLAIKANYEMMNRQEWFSVTVPMGMYTVGIDIPAGRYTIKCVENQHYCIFEWGEYKNNQLLTSRGGSAFIYGEKSEYTKDSDTKSINAIFNDGQVIKIKHGDCVFYPYTPAFSFN